jgi:hypothetical protein
MKPIKPYNPRQRKPIGLLIVEETSPRKYQK